MKKILIFLPLLLLFLIPDTKAEISDGWYTIGIKTNSSMRLDTTDYKNKICSSIAKNNSSQKFYITQINDGLYTIRTGASAGMKALSTSGQQKAYSKSSTDQRWKIQEKNNTYQLINAKTNKALEYSISGITEVTKNTTDKQKFILNPFIEKFTVTFKGEANETLKRTSVKRGDGATAPSLPSKTGYTSKWDKSFNKITSNTTINVTLVPKTVKVIFHRNTSETDSVTYAEKYTYGVSEERFGMNISEEKKEKGQFGTWMKTGYTLLGWSDKQDATSKKWNVYNGVSDNWKDNHAGTKDLYAVWQINNYKVTFDGNGATSGSTTELSNKAYNSSQILSANGFKRNGYTFKGWNTKKDGTGTSYNNKDSFQIPAKDTVLYAQWTPNQYTITFNGNNHTSGTTNSMISSCDSTNILNENQFIKTGYDFISWNTKADGTGIEYKNKASFKTPANDITLYAQWKNKTVNVTFYRNIGIFDNTKYTENYTYGNTNQNFGMNIGSERYSFNNWTKPNYKLIGWSENRFANKNTYTTNSSISNKWIDEKSPSVNFYAIWEGETKWSNKGEIGDVYYKNGEIVKGLHKIGNIWYLFDKKTGKFTGEKGNNIYLGSFFDKNSSRNQQLFFTIDGKNFHKIVNGNHKARDMSYIYKNGKFYGTSTKGGDRDHIFYIHESTDLKEILQNKPTSVNPENVKYVKDDVSKTTTYRSVWAPEWLVDYKDNTTGDYIYYCAEDNNQTFGTANTPTFKIYRSKVDSLPNNIGTPEECTFDNYEEMQKTNKGMIDPSVIKTKDGYVMVVKWQDGAEKTDVYTSTDGLDWKFKSRLSMFAGALLPSTVEVLNPQNKFIVKENDKYVEKTLSYDKLYLTGDPSKIDSETIASPKLIKNEEGEWIEDEKGDAKWVITQEGQYFTANIGWEGATLTYIDGLYYMYIDHYIYTRVNGMEAFEDDNGNGNGMSYDGKIHYAISEDLENWTYKGEIETEGYSVRHGSVNIVTEEKAQKIIQNLYNDHIVYNDSTVWYKITEKKPQFYQTKEESNLEIPTSMFSKSNGEYAINAGTSQHYPVFNGKTWTNTTYTAKRTWYDVILLKQDGLLEYYPNGTSKTELEKLNPVWVVGGFDPLILNGKQIKTEEYNSETENGVVNTKHPRTFIGQLTDGKYFYGVVAGRDKDNFSKGYTYDELCNFVINNISPISKIKLLFNMDGGGTSAFIYEGFKLNSNYSSKSKEGQEDYPERKCNSIFVFE